MVPVNGEDSFRNRVFVVTGGASGIGFASAQELLTRGAIVVIADLQGALSSYSREALEKEHPTRFEAVECDISISEHAGTLMEFVVAKFGRLDGLVSSAGIRMQKTMVVDLDDAVWDRVISVNLRGTFTVNRAATRVMSGTGGSIVNVASISGKVARLGQSAYAASKAAVIQLSRVLALEVADRGIRVNVVCPGTTDTPMIDAAKVQDGRQVLKERIYGSARAFRPGIPLRRIATPLDQANAIAFLLSDAASHITGETLLVDGGETLI